MSSNVNLEDGEVNSAKSWERSLSLRITILLIVSTFLLIGQSLYNLSSIEDVDDSIQIVNKAAFNLDNLSRNIKTPISNIRILSMEMVSAPNRESLDETIKRFDVTIQHLEETLDEWGLVSRSVSEREAFSEIVSSWENYRLALLKTFYYIDNGIRVAAFISVTGQEKDSYDQLQNNLNVFSQMLVSHSKEVFLSAEEQSSFSYISSVVTSAIQVLILTVTLIFVYRMFKTYMRASQAYEKKIVAKEAQLRMALDNMPGAMAVVNKDLDLVLLNDQYKEFYGDADGLTVVGGSMRDILRKEAELGYISGEGSLEEILEKRMESFQSNKTQIIHDTAIGGRAIQITRKRTPDGYSVSVATDISKIIEAEQSLSKAYDTISHSIDYASRIQRSVLPSTDTVESSFLDHFVIWDPRDVVGGDTYWCHNWGEGTLIILGDCTGHGVPGALMTLISTGALDRALIEIPVGNVSGLVQRMHQLVQQTLGQDGEEAESDDGLELGACFINSKESKLTFVGARFDLFEVIGDVVERHKGDKKGIGYHEVSQNQKFNEIHINVTPASSFYLTTDGFVDQISDTSMRSFGKRRFGKLLLDIQNKTMDEQKEAIRYELARHQGEAPRLDDIAVIGFKMLPFSGVI